jgi:hypothetical protein
MQSRGKFAALAVLVGWLLAADTQAEAPKISGFLDLTYNRNLDASDARTNVHHSFDTQGNTFLLNAFHLAMTGAEGDHTDYVLEVDMGTDASAITSGGVGAGDDFDVQEAYVVHRFGDGKLGFKAGKFVTYNGIEVIESGADPTITRGYLFGLAEPYTHTGAVVTYQISPQVDVHAGLVNGWDLFVDNNKAPTGVLKLGLNFGDPLALTVSSYLGPEQTGNEDDVRTTLDVTGVSKAGANLDLWFQFNYGQEAKAAPSGDDASWIGFGLQPVYRLTETFSVGLRYEYFKDSDGARTATAQALQNITITPTYSLSENLLTRAELRVDISDEEVFLDGDNAPTDQQLQIAAELIYSFE